MTASTRPRLLAWALGVLGGFGFLLLGLLEGARSGWSGIAEAAVHGAPLVVFFVCLGTLLALRRPDNPIGWLLSAGGLFWLLMSACAAFAEYAVARDDVTVPARVAAGLDYSGWPIGQPL